MNRLLGIFLILVSATAFGTMSIFAQFAYASGAGVTTVLFLRFAIAAIVLNLFVFSQKIALPTGKNRLGLMLIGSIGFVLQSICFFSALKFAPAGLVGLLLYLYPTLVMVITMVVLKERPTTTKIIALGLASFGLILTIGLTSGGQIPGILLGIASAIIYATYVIAGSQIMTDEEPIPACTIILSCAAVVFGGIVAFQGLQLPMTLPGWLAVGAIALISTVLAVVTLFAGIKLIGPTNASTLSTLEPLVTIVLAAVILHQSISLLQLVGGLFILSAVVLLARQELQTNPKYGELQ